ncbi:MAG: 16S rRNA (guanine(527)-N(7))-methyltransferase RsmG [Litoreibacter sp.]|nr:16S rRNA (guanine(527)-N(7))-methyltransferase RsmG [Litoreibacter sp.]
MDVSRETLHALEFYTDLLKKWNPKINLVAAGTLNEAWTRHIEDSAQVFKLIPDGARSLVDLGSGGGFPGLVLAILANEHMPGLKISLLESDARKCAFLTTVSGALGLGANVLNQRIESAAPVESDVVTARALAPLPRLLPLIQRHLSRGGVALLLKGANYQEEVDEALASWAFDLQKIQSATSDQSVVLRISNLRPISQR